MRANPDRKEHGPGFRHALWPTKGRLRAILRARITAGLIIVLPVWVTVLLVTFVFRLMRDASLWVVEGLLSGAAGRFLLDRWSIDPMELRARGLEALPVGLQWGLSLFAVLLTVGLLYTIGAISTNFLGRRLVRTAESVVHRVPFVKTVHSACKQVLETLMGEGAQNFQRVCLVPFPNERLRSVAFVTRICKDRVTGEELLNVFLATVPNPTTGFVFVVRRADVIELDWSVEDAVKVVMSGGVLSPESYPFSTPTLGAEVVKDASLNSAAVQEA